MKNLFSLSALCAAALLATAAVAAPVSSMSERSIGQGSLGTILARENESRNGKDDPKGHRLSEEFRGELVAKTETSHGGKRRPAGKAGA